MPPQWQAEAAGLRDALIAAALETGAAANASVAEAALQLAERRISADVACGICFDAIAATPGKRFGLLSGCTHAFCLDCIRAWRARLDLPTETTRSCPQCRTLAYVILPSDRYITEPARKAALGEAYHSHQRSLPCRLFNGGKGECPFGSSCWYAHTNADGTAHIAARPAIRLDAEGAVSRRREYKLSDFL